MKKNILTKDHLDDCVNVFVKAYNTAPWNCKWTAENAREYLSELIDHVNFTGFIIYDNNDVAGAILGHRKTWWTDQQLMINELFVSPEFQKRGYGKMLMQQMEDYAASRGIKLLALMTNKYLPVYEFYEQVDYTAADQYVFMFKQLPG